MVEIVKMSVNLNKALLGTIGKWLPLRRHPGGGVLPIRYAAVLLRE